jgi:hypothetical protein
VLQGTGWGFPRPVMMGLKRRKEGNEVDGEGADGRIETSALLRHDRLDVERVAKLRGRRAAAVGGTRPNRTDPCSPFMV